MRHRHLETEGSDEALTPEARARQNIRERRRLQDSLLTFGAVGAFLVVIWVASGAGYFWPGWVMAAFGLVLVLRYAKNQRGPVSQEEVEREVDRLQSKGRGRSYGPRNDN